MSVLLPCPAVLLAPPFLNQKRFWKLSNGGAVADLRGGGNASRLLFREVSSRFSLSGGAVAGLDGGRAETPLLELPGVKLVLGTSRGVL